jgi:hypothetical protein
MHFPTEKVWFKGLHSQPAGHVAQVYLVVSSTSSIDQSKQRKTVGCACGGFIGCVCCTGVALFSVMSGLMAVLLLSGSVELSPASVVRTCHSLCWSAVTRIQIDTFIHRQRLVQYYRCTVMVSVQESTLRTWADGRVARTWLQLQTLRRSLSFCLRVERRNWYRPDSMGLGQGRMNAWVPITRGRTSSGWEGPVQVRRDL